MLLLFGLVFLLVDFVMGGVDILHDIIGFLLLTLQCIVLNRDKKLPGSCTFIGVLSVFCSLLAFFPFPIPFYVTGMEILLAILCYFFVRTLYIGYFRLSYEDSRHRLAQDDLAGSHALVTTCLVLILLCEICNPILSLVSILSYLLWAIKTAAGIFIVIRIYKMSRYDALF